MFISSPQLVPQQTSEQGAPLGPRIGHIVSVCPPDAIEVDFQGNPHGPLRAGSVVMVDDTWRNRKVLLVFENSDLRRPVIVGVLQDHPAAATPNILAELDRKEMVDILVDGEKLVVDAHREIEIRCGLSSLIMKPDGQVILKGNNITARARRNLKIKGAAVRIN